MTEQPPGERIAKLEECTETLEVEVASLRDTRHEHAKFMQLLDGRIRENEKEMKTMALGVVPEIRRTLSRHAQEIRKTREHELTQKTSLSVWMKIGGVILGVALTVGQAMIIYLLTKP